MINSSLNILAITGIEHKQIIGKKRVFFELSKKMKGFVNFNEVSLSGDKKIIIPGQHYIYYLFLYANKINQNLNDDTDLIHAFSQVETFLFPKIKSEAPKIATCLDIIPIVYPQNNVNFIENLFIKYSIKGMEKADKIICISEHTKKDLINFTNIDPDKIETIYLGINENFKKLRKDQIESFKQQYSLQNPFILYVGSEQPRKNFISLVKAFYKLTKIKGFEELKLVKVGKPQTSRRERKKLMEFINGLGLQEKIKFIDYVDEINLPKLYNAADLFVFPSLYEGFGLPPLESMACGTPVIASNRASVPEVVGDAGIVLDPLNIDQLTKEMENVLNSESLQKELFQKGLNRSRKFTWENCAKDTLKVYNELLD